MDGGRVRRKWSDRARLVRAASCVLLLLLAQSCGDSASEQSSGSIDTEPDTENASDGALELLAKSSIATPTQYSVTISGNVHVGSGKTIFSQKSTVYLRRTIDTTNVANNGINPVDVGIKTAASPLSGSAGALWFATNTSLSAEIGSSAVIASSKVDVAYVSINGGKVTANVDGNAMGLPSARINYLNVFNAKSGLTAQIYNVLSGRVTASVTSKGKSISGTIDLTGSSGFSSGAATTRYVATFSGKRK